MFYGYGYYLLFLSPAIILGLWAQMRVRSTYASARRLPAPLSGAAAARHILDSAGLLMEGREFADEYKHEFAWPAELCAKFGWSPDMPPGLERVIESYEPTMLIGTTGQPGAFTQLMIRKMARAVERPAIFPFSNPTSKSEATPEDLLAWTDGRALVATGSPFDPVQVGDRRVRIAQGNNVYVFPGVGLGALAISARRITDSMFTAAAVSLSEQVTAADLAAGSLYPPVASLREVTIKIAARVAQAAIDERVADKPDGEIEDAIQAWVWDPQYPELVPE